MANPRQRRKSRSGSYKPVHHSRRAKKILKKQPAIRGSKILQEAWDKRKTVRQNYAALGLATSLNPRPSGGVEPVLERSEESQRFDQDVDMTQKDAELMQGGSMDKPIPQGHGRIIRDGRGNIIGLDLGDSGVEQAMERSELVEDRATGVTLETVDWVPLGKQPGKEIAQSNLIKGQELYQCRSMLQALEKTPSSSDKIPRFSSTSEMSYLQKLISKYQEDVEAMALDRKLNPDQRTAGQLRRAIRKAGGSSKLTSHRGTAAVDS